MLSPNLRSLLFFEKKALTFNLSKLVRLPKKKKIFTLQKSPFVQSKAKEHFQIRLHKRLYFFNLTFSELKKLLFYVPTDVAIVIEQDI